MASLTLFSLNVWLGSFVPHPIKNSTIWFDLAWWATAQYYSSLHWFSDNIDLTLNARSIGQVKLSSHEKSPVWLFTCAGTKAPMKSKSHSSTSNLQFWLQRQTQQLYYSLPLSQQLHFSDSAFEDLILYIPHGQALKPDELSVAKFSNCHPNCWARDQNLYDVSYILLLSSIFTTPAQTT